MPFNHKLLRPKTAVAPFSPLDIANLALWLDASDSATLFDATSGGSAVAADGSVARWEDKSGNARHVTNGTANNRPILKTALQNGRSGLRFDNSNDSLSTASFTHTAAFSVFVAHKLASSPSGGFARIIEVGGNQSWIVATNGTGANYNFDTTNTNIILRTTPLLIQYFSGGSTDRAYRIGSDVNVSYTEQGAASTSSLPFHINRFGGAGNYFIGQDVYEICYYARKLTDSERVQVADYLTTKWGL